MSPRARAARPTGATFHGWDTATLGLAALSLTLVTAVALWIAAALACLVTGRPIPNGGLTPALTALTHPAAPAGAWPHPEQLPSPVTYWSTTVAVFAVVSFLVCLTVLAGSRRWSSRDDPARRLRAMPGLATPAEADRQVGRRALLARAAAVRPSRPNPTSPHQVGYRIGTTLPRHNARGHRGELWCSVEDSILLVGPPRMGKGLHIVIPWVLDAPGPVITTSTRPDTLTVTHQARQRRGPVAVFDPQRLSGVPSALAWSPIRGCQHPRTALIRARGLAAGTGYGPGVSDSAFWTAQTETALRCLLHAAALGDRDPLDLYRWSLDPVLAQDAVTTLTRSPDAADGWADALDAIVHLDPRTRDSVWLGVRQALACLADSDVLHAVTPRSGHAFDPARFLAESGTLYLLASAVASGSCGPLIAAFVEDITETARTLAAHSPGARLDPPLLLALDEIAQLTPLPSLPSLMAEGGGTGITTLAVLQSLAQARHRWGEHSADAIWDAATTKIILGGLGKYRDLDDIARLLGDIDETTHSLSRGRDGQHTATVGVRTVPVMPASLLRTLPVGTAVLLLRHTRPVTVHLSPWLARPDAARLRADQASVESATRPQTRGAPALAATVPSVLPR